MPLHLLTGVQVCFVSFWELVVICRSLVVGTPQAVVLTYTVRYSTILSPNLHSKWSQVILCGMEFPKATHSLKATVLHNMGPLGCSFHSGLHGAKTFPL